MPPIATTVIVAVGSFALGLLLPLLALRLVPARLRAQPAFHQGAPRRWARLASGPVVFVSLAAPILLASPRHAAAILPGTALMFVVGLLDDVRTFRRWVKGVAVICAAVISAHAGISIDAIKPPFTTTMVPLGILSIPLTAIWMGGLSYGLLQTKNKPVSGTLFRKSNLSQSNTTVA